MCRRPFGLGMELYSKNRVTFTEFLLFDHKIDSLEFWHELTIQTYLAYDFVSKLPIHTDFRLVDDACYPYKGVSDHCKVRRSDTLSSAGCELPVTVPRDHLYRVGPAYSLNNESDIMNEIFESGPVQGNK